MNILLRFFLAMALALAESGAQELSWHQSSAGFGELTPATRVRRTPCDLRIATTPARDSHMSGPPGESSEQVAQRLLRASPTATRAPSPSTTSNPGDALG